MRAGWSLVRGGGCGGGCGRLGGDWWSKEQHSPALVGNSTVGPMHQSGSCVGHGLVGWRGAVTMMRDSSGQYRLVKKIGRGGMGQVWQAVRVGAEGLMMPCAIKVLLLELAQTQKDRARFFNEARIAARLDHGNIVKVIDTGELQGCPFLVMVWVDGINLRELVRRAAQAGLVRLRLEVCCFIVGEVLAALQYAHNRTEGGRDAGVIHYDVTPGNILISSSGEVKLTDFGIAHFAATAGTLSRSIGTPRYMSPEQITGHPRTESDIYSLGVVLWELVAGSRYLEGADVDQFRARVLMGPPAEIERDEVPEWLRRLIRQMLAVRPEQRPNAAECRTLLLNNTPNYHAADQALQSLYGSLVGAPSSGLTELMSLGQAVEELRVAGGQSVSLGTAPPEADADAPKRRAKNSPMASEAGLAHTGETIEPTELLPPPPPEPEAVESAMGEREATVEARRSRSVAVPVPVDAGVAGAPANVRVPGWLIGGFFTFALLNVGVFAWVLLSQPEQPTAAEVVERRPVVETEQPATVAEQPRAPAKAVEEVRPTPTEPAPVAEVERSEPVEVEPIVDSTTPTKADVEPAPKPKKAQPAREEVVFMIDGIERAEIKVGSRTYPHNLAAYAQLRPGNHAVAWRKSDSDGWRSAGTLTVEDLPGKQYYDVKISGSKLTKTVRGAK